MSATDRDRELRPESATVMRQDLEASRPRVPAAKRLESITDATPVRDPCEDVGSRPAWSMFPTCLTR